MAQQGEQSQQEQGVVQERADGGQTEHKRPLHPAKGPHDIEQDQDGGHRHAYGRGACEFSAHNRPDGGVAELLAGSGLLKDRGDQRVLGFDVQGRCAYQGAAVVGQLNCRPRVAAGYRGGLDGLLVDLLVEAELDERTAGEVNAGLEAAGQQRDDAGQQQRERQQVPPAAAGRNGEHQVLTLAAPAPKRRGRVSARQVMARRSKFRLTVMALNILTATPMARVTAKPRTPPLPKPKSTAQMMRVEMLESRIEVHARLKPDSTAPRMARPARSSSRVRSNIRMLASTATPTERMNPATPESVSVTGISLKTAKTTEV